MVTLRAGDVLCTATPVSWKSPVSWLCGAIRLLSRSDWSHCALVVECWSRLYVCEALATGVVMRPLEDWPRIPRVCVMRPKAPVDVAAFCTKALSKVGHTGYDYSSLLWYQVIYQLTGHWMGHTSASRKTDKKLYCSEYCAWAFPECFPKWWSVAPSEFHLNTADFDHVYEGPASGI